MDSLIYIYIYIYIFIHFYIYLSICIYIYIKLDDRPLFHARSHVGENSGEGGDVREVPREVQPRYTPTPCTLHPTPYTLHLRLNKSTISGLGGVRRGNGLVPFTRRLISLVGVKWSCLRIDKHAPPP